MAPQNKQEKESGFPTDDHKNIENNPVILISRPALPRGAFATSYLFSLDLSQKARFTKDLWRCPEYAGI